MDGSPQPQARRPLTTDPPKTPGLASVLERNIRALVERRAREQRQARWSDQLAERITAFTGSMAFVWLHLLVFGAWIVVNLGWIPGAPRWDPTFVVLAMVASVEAIFLSTFVLISQNRMTREADKRADLDLQINLLAEHEVTRLLILTRAIAERLGIEVDGGAMAEVQGDVAPEAVLDEIEETRERHKS